MFGSLTKLCLYGSYRISKGAAMDPHPKVIPTTPAGYPVSKGSHREPHKHLIPPRKFTNEGCQSNLPLKVPLKAPFKAPSICTSNV